MGLLEAHAALAGKLAVVVGGASGFIGRAISVALARAGVSIACCDNDVAGIAAIVPEIESLGVRILAVEADVANPDCLDWRSSWAPSRFG